MLVLVIVLALTNAASVALVLWLLRQRRAAPDADDTDTRDTDADTRALAEGLRHSDPGVRPRRLISVEILNPIELAGTRGFLARVAGSLAPRVVRRMVYEETVKQLRRQLRDEHVVADVRLHTLPEPSAAIPAQDMTGDGDDAVLDARPVSVEVEQPPPAP